MLRHYKKAFTLIELITVISIIGLLSAIAVSSMKSSNDKAKLAASQSFEASIGRVVGDQIIGEWLFDEGSGTTARDTSGNGNDGTISGATWTSGINGNALSFNGAAQVSLGSSAALNPANFTITAWVKPGDISGSYNYIYSNTRDCCGSYNGLDFYIGNNTLAGLIWNGTPAIARATSSPPDPIASMPAPPAVGVCESEPSNVLPGLLNRSRNTWWQMPLPARENQMPCFAATDCKNR